MLNFDGSAVGNDEGTLVVGRREGQDKGREVGIMDGNDEGCLEGIRVGCNEG